MNVALWVVQVLLAVVYLLSGGMKVLRPIDSLATFMHWVKTVPPGVVRSIGVAEILGAIGLILPAVTGVLPWLTILAAAGLVLVQIGAGYVHGSRQEYVSLPFNVVLLLLAAFIAYGRLAVVPL